MSTPALAPGELLAAMAGGDQRALDALYRGWSRKVRVFAHAKLLRCGLDADAIADEVTVDVFHDLWRAPLRYDGRIEFASWLLTLTRNKTVDQIRRHGKRQAAEVLLDEEGELEQAAATHLEMMAPSPMVLQENAQRRSAVLNCLRRLRNPLQRESLTLWALEDLSVGEIARIQGAVEGTVKSRLFHGRLNLRQCLERWFVQEGGRHG
ncbi:sigma-70 family RNA polymerase sigma factor [Duganella sp. FT109W]|uniref:Sigma-70 family RNA polymerase sigma factor n=1 Tax=Duganella margarita TaxID=2692170 RepID=A0A7X4KJG0_9BURK|nr:RNA polymerase sigma factor [Duganella margarita]MYM74558.1 sigma-70 family RNA polymerase sigma factor [Duganella margarita]MYN37761.1 sigma-70 family RNA polymerase sigma factor [Duganella margarita]